MSPETRRIVRRLRALEERRGRERLISVGRLFELAEATSAAREAAFAALATDSSKRNWQRSTARALVAGERAVVARRARVAGARDAVREAAREKEERAAQRCQAQLELSEILRGRALLEDHERAARLRLLRVRERRQEAELQDAWPRIRNRNVD